MFNFFKNLYYKVFGYNLFIDDQCNEKNTDNGTIIRDPKRIDPTQKYIKVENVDQALKIIEKLGCPKYISFDHDLGLDIEGNERKSGYDFAKMLVESDLEANGAYIPQNFGFRVHSANPIGKANIEAYLNNYLKQR